MNFVRGPEGDLVFQLTLMFSQTWPTGAWMVQSLSFALGDGYCGDKDNDGDKDDDEGSGGDDDDDHDDSCGGGGGGDAEVDATPAATIIICTKVELKPSAQF